MHLSSKWLSFTIRITFFGAQYEWSRTIRLDQFDTERRFEISRWLGVNSIPEWTTSWFVLSNYPYKSTTQIIPNSFTNSYILLAILIFQCVNTTLLYIININKLKVQQDKKLKTFDRQMQKWDSFLINRFQVEDNMRRATYCAFYWFVATSDAIEERKGSRIRRVELKSNYTDEINK